MDYKRDVQAYLQAGLSSFEKQARFEEKHKAIALPVIRNAVSYLLVSV